MLADELRASGAQQVTVLALDMASADSVTAAFEASAWMTGATIAVDGGHLCSPL